MTSLALVEPKTPLGRRVDTHFTPAHIVPSPGYTAAPVECEASSVPTKFCSGRRHKDCGGVPCKQGFPKPSGRAHGTGVGQDNTHGRRRRLSRLREYARAPITAAIPQGSLRVQHTLQCWRALHELPGYALARKDLQLTLSKTLYALIRCAEFTTMATRPTWAILELHTGRTRGTIQRALKQLREWGLIGIVASGRTAAYAAKGADGQRINEAAVYVLCRPAGRGLRGLPILPQHQNDVANREGMAVVSVDKKDPPPAKQGVKSLDKSHLHAREEKTPGMEPLRGPAHSRHGASAVRRNLPAHRSELTWERHKTMASDGTCLAGISTIRNRSAVLRYFSLRDLRALMRPFLDAGWTVADIEHALQALPAPEKATGRELWGALQLPSHGEHTTSWTIRTRELIRHRLTCWITDAGEVMRSYDQRLRAEQSYLRAQARASYAREEASQAYARAGGAQTGTAAGIALLRSTLANLSAPAESTKAPR